MEFRFVGMQLVEMVVGHEVVVTSLIDAQPAHPEALRSYQTWREN